MTDKRYVHPVAGVPMEQLPAAMRKALAAVEAAWPGGRVGITLFVFDFGEGGGLSYISNADRANMIRTVDEWLVRVRGSSN